MVPGQVGHLGRIAEKELIPVIEACQAWDSQCGSAGHPLLRQSVIVADLWSCSSRHKV